MLPSWYRYIEPLSPTLRLEADFDSTTYLLQAAVNIRRAVRLVEPSLYCLKLAEDVLGHATAYGYSRDAAANEKAVADAARALDESIWRLLSEMVACSERKFLRSRPLLPQRRAARLAPAAPVASQNSYTPQTMVR